MHSINENDGGYIYGCTLRTMAKCTPDDPFPRHRLHFHTSCPAYSQVKTLSTAQVTPDEIQLHLAEDVKTGQLMLSLPPIPFHLRRPARKYPPPKRNPYVDIPPPSTKTGLVRIDIRGYLSNYMGGDGYAGDRAFGWHNLKKEKVWVEAWERARRDLGKKRLKWIPPRGLEFLRLDREEVVQVDDVEVDVSVVQ